jgi:pSer/pThr/pTyr-binding forkhead associated (FHA) protein
MEALTKISRKTPKAKRPTELIEYFLVTSLKKNPIALDKKKRFTIGRNKKNTLAVPQATTSETHASLKWGKTSFKIKDEKSTNGTFVNNKRIKGEATLKDKDKIKIGKFTLTYKVKKTRIKKEAVVKKAAKKPVKKTAPKKKPAKNAAKTKKIIKKKR